MEIANIFRLKVLIDFTYEINMRYLLIYGNLLYEF